MLFGWLHFWYCYNEILWNTSIVCFPAVFCRPTLETSQVGKSSDGKRWWKYKSVQCRWIVHMVQVMNLDRHCNYINKLKRTFQQTEPEETVFDCSCSDLCNPLLTPDAGCYKESQRTHFVRRDEPRDKGEERISI